jgi:hypothetical protein
MQAAQGLRRFDSQLRDEYPASLRIARQCLGPLARGGQRPNEEVPRLLPQRVLGHERAQIGQAFRGAVGVDEQAGAGLAGGMPLARQPFHRRTPDRRDGQALQRLAAPQRERVVQFGQRAARGEPLESRDIKLVAIEAQLVPRKSGVKP